MNKSEMLAALRIYERFCVMVTVYRMEDGKSDIAASLRNLQRAAEDGDIAGLMEHAWSAGRLIGLADGRDERPAEVVNEDGANNFDRAKDNYGRVFEVGKIDEIVAGRKVRKEHLGKLETELARLEKRGQRKLANVIRHRIEVLVKFMKAHEDDAPLVIPPGVAEYRKWSPAKKKQAHRDIQRLVGLGWADPFEKSRRERRRS
jgi:hypothetical protein